MIRIVKWLTVTSLVLLTSGIHAGDLIEHRVNDPSAAIDYWTNQKMQDAEPMPLFDVFALSMDVSQASLTASEPARELNDGERERLIEGVQRRIEHEDQKQRGHQPRFDICGDESSCTVILPDELRDDSPHVAIGKLFFTLFGFDFQCSAAAVTSRGPGGPGNRQTILTAGHCCSDGAGTFDEYALFVPAYDQGEAPYGMWSAQTLTTTHEWNMGFGQAFGRDVCVIRTAPGAGDFEGQDLHDVVGALGIKFNNRHPVGTDYSLNGYPIDGWGGEEPVITLGSATVLDLAYEPPPVGVASLMTGGSSGGPWLLRYRPDSNQMGNGQRGKNVINGINAYKYNELDMLFSPYFDTEIYALWQFAAHQP